VKQQESIKEALEICSDVLYDAANKGYISEYEFNLADEALWQAQGHSQKKWGKEEKEVELEGHFDWDMMDKMCSSCPYRNTATETVWKTAAIAALTTVKSRKKKSKPKIRLIAPLPRRIRWR